MTQRTLLIADIHLDSIKEAEYRWEIFDYLAKVILKENIKSLIILGDLTERKNNHDSMLVNRLVSDMSDISDMLEDKLIIVKGNHDYDKSPDNVFFKFLHEFADIYFIDKPLRLNDEYFLPHTKTPQKDWSNLDFRGIERIFMHQCVQGARFANNYETDKGVCIDDLIPKNIKIYAGDIHLPQLLGERFTYIGSPYSVDYGDHYDGRVLILEEGKEDISLYPNFLKKWSIVINDISDLDKYELRKNDRIQVKINLLPSEYCEWRIKRDSVIEYLEDKGLFVKGVSMNTIKPKRRLRIMPKATEYYALKTKTSQDWIRQYAKKEEISENYLDVGLSLVKV